MYYKMKKKETLFFKLNGYDIYITREYIHGQILGRLKDVSRDVISDVISEVCIPNSDDVSIKTLTC